MLQQYGTVADYIHGHEKNARNYIVLEWKKSYSFQVMYFT